MDSIQSKVWKGDPNGLKQREAEAYGSLVSPYYSAANEERAKGNRVAALKFAILAIICARITRNRWLSTGNSLFAIPANTLDVMGATFLNFPWFIGGSVKLAMACYSTANDPGHYDQRENRLLPHQKSLIQTGLAKSLVKRGYLREALREASRSANRSQLILREQEQTLAKRQLVRILRDDGVILVKHGGEEEVAWGRRLLGDAAQLIRGFGEDGESQYRKFLFVLKREGISL